MVDPLPVGVSLTAIFDSCHSGTLLDLDHYKCNNVAFPWNKKCLRKSTCAKHGAAGKGHVLNAHITLTNLT